ncbi:MAG: 4Fe-4S binding protein [Magnetococcus sp. WYHC-3]
MTSHGDFPLATMNHPAHRAILHSRGTLLIIGPAHRVSLALPCLPPETRAVVALSEGELTCPPRQHVLVWHGVLQHLEGYLGRFHPRSGADATGMDLAALAPHGDGWFDLVLDLGDTALIQRECPPPGYFATTGPQEQIQAGVRWLTPQQGHFQQPIRTAFDPGKCAQDRQGLPGCRLCLESCPAEAVSRGPHGVTVNPFLCRGCGACTQICPTGAIHSAPPRDIHLSVLAVLAGSQRSEKGAAVTIAVRDQRNAAASVPSGTALLAVECPGQMGMELWFAALALGAASVVYHLADIGFATTRHVIAEQFQTARRILAACGGDPERLVLWDGDGPAPGQPPPVDWEPLQLADLAMLRDKRSLLLTSLRRIVGHVATPRLPLPLESPATFGRIELDGQRCTLCLACSRICPSNALSAPTGSLCFQENRCVQCGLCVGACPERIMRMTPRLDPRTLRDNDSSVILKQADAMALCRGCGSPHPSMGMLRSVTLLLQQNPALHAKDTHMLDLCPGCRQKAVAAEVFR